MVSEARSADGSRHAAAAALLLGLHARVEREEVEEGRSVTTVVQLDEDEKYLYAILSDPTGLDQAEFLWDNPEAPDGVYRAWAFQWLWYTCEDTYQADQGARAVGKTVGITMRAFRFPFVFEGQDMLITAPELNHLDPLYMAIEERLESCWLTWERRPQGKSNGITRQPHWTGIGEGTDRRSPGGVRPVALPCCPGLQIVRGQTPAPRPVVGALLRAPRR